MPRPKMCPRCGVELGTGLHLVPQAKGSNLCIECATEMDGTGFDEGPEPTMNEEDAAPWVESYREAMKDAGRGHLLS